MCIGNRKRSWQDRLWSGDYCGGTAKTDGLLAHWASREAPLPLCKSHRQSSHVLVTAVEILEHGHWSRANRDALPHNLLSEDHCGGAPSNFRTSSHHNSDDCPRLPLNLEAAEPSTMDNTKSWSKSRIFDEAGTAQTVAESFAQSRRNEMV